MADLTIVQLHSICKHAPVKTLETMLPHLNSAMDEAGITTKLRQASFLGQVLHESAEFMYLKELASGVEYEGRHDLGNTESGDGVRYKGRGLIQVTGRSNYTRCGDALGVDLVNHPELAESPEMACRVSTWFWTEHELNKLADESNNLRITKIVNGGTSDDAPTYFLRRMDYYKRAIAVLK